MKKTGKIMLGLIALAVLLVGCGSKEGSNQSTRKVTGLSTEQTEDTEMTRFQKKKTITAPLRDPFATARSGANVATEKSTSASSEETTEKDEYDTKNNVKEGELSGKTICIDPGHGITSASKREKVSPKSDTTKPAYVSGAESKHQTEEELNLAVSLKVRDMLEEEGADVIMTREEDHATVSNIERAEIANQSKADICVRIHADDAGSSSPQGFSILVPSGDLLGTPSIVTPSLEAAKKVEGALADSTGANDRGIVRREDMTGFNWSEVPVILVEMGFLSNPEEDEKLATDSYRTKVAEGIAEGLKLWFREDR